MNKLIVAMTLGGFLLPSIAEAQAPPTRYHRVTEAGDVQLALVAVCAPDALVGLAGAFLCRHVRGRVALDGAPGPQDLREPPKQHKEPDLQIKAYRPR